MQGFNIAEAGHVVNVLSPQNISGGVTGQAFSTKGAAHVSIILQFGAFGAALPTAILLNACTAAAGTGATAIGFRYYPLKTFGQSSDILAAPVIAAATGILAAVLTKTNNQFIVIELDVAELDSYFSDSDGSDYPYLQLQITDSGNATYASAIAVLSAERFAYQGGATATS